MRRKHNMFKEIAPGVALFLLLMICFCGIAWAQTDSTRLGRLEAQLRILRGQVSADSARLAETERNTFYLYKYVQKSDTNRPRLTIGGYLDAYYAIYSDSVAGEYHRFPTSAPRSDQFALNMFYLSARYSTETLRGNVGLQFGDIPACAWSEKYNMIQEANMGMRFKKHFWLDAGFFRTHIGMESIQPRENITQSLAVTTYFEPYYLSGVKLSYQPNDQLTLQVNAFNGFNTFVETNRNKAVGLSATYLIDNKSAITFNTIFCDESPTLQLRKQRRFYNDFYFAHRSEKLDFGAEANFGIQTNSQLADTSKTALIYSFIVAAKYKFGRMGVYGRGEMFEDSDEILTGPVENENHQLVGINVVGGTAGFELRPLENGYLRLEGRYLQCTANERIFYRDGQFYNHRWEGIAAMGVWF